MTLSPPLEREDALAALQQRLDDARRGAGHVVLVVGEAGAGKTTLLREFARRQASGVRFVWGWCEHLFTPRPLGPLVDMAPHLGSEAQAVLARLGAQDGAVPSMHRLFSAIADELRRDASPRVLLVEDLHWADRGTLDFVKFLARRIDGMCTLLLVTFRDDELTAGHPLHQVLGELPVDATTRISPAPLTEAAVAQLVAARSRAADGPSGVAAVDARRVHRLTRGNPFFVTEVLIAGHEAVMPQSVTAAVLARAARLDPDERRAFEWVSVVPGGAELELLDAAMSAAERAGLDRCVNLGLLQFERSHVTFRHELARRAAEGAIAPATLRAMHARVLAWMQVHRADDAARLAYHAAAIGDARLVLQTAPAAARAAARLGAHAEAADHWSRAIAFAEHADDDERAALHEQWTYECGIAGRIDRTVVEACRHAIEIRRRQGRVESLGRNLYWLGRMLWYLGDGDAAAATADEAVRTLESRPRTHEYCLALCLRAQTLMLREQPHEAIAVGERAVALAEMLDAKDSLAHALNTIGAARAMLADDGAHAWLERSLAISLSNDFHEQAARAYTNGAWSAIETRDYARAERLAREGIAYDTEHDLDSWTPYLAGLHAGLLLTLGRIGDAVATATDVLARPRLTPLVRLPALSALGRACVLLGDARALPLLEEARSLAEPLREPMRVVKPVLLPLVEYHWLRDDIDAARDVLDAAGRWAVASPWERGEVAVWRRRLEPGARVDDESAYAPPYRFELAGDLEAAAREWRRLPAPIDEALMWIACASADPAALNRAIALAEAAGAPTIAHRARALARHQGTRGVKRGAYAGSRGNPFGLTRREVQILGLVQQGLANKAIARELALSLRTIEHHLSAMYAKLGAANRVDALRIWQQQPPGP